MTTIADNAKKLQALADTVPSWETGFSPLTKQYLDLVGNILQILGPTKSQVRLEQAIHDVCSKVLDASAASSELPEMIREVAALHLK